MVYHTTDWRLFIDASMSSLKAVLLHNGNEYATVPVAHSGSLKETYDNLDFLLQKKYFEHQWIVCGDLKIIGLLLGQHWGYTKTPCFPCEFDKTMSPKERRAWNAFKEVVENFLGNNKHPNYADMVEELLENYHKLGCNMRLKHHFYTHTSIIFLRI